MPKKVLVLCTGNSCRSQMAHGIIQALQSSWEVYSAGVETHGLNPNAVQAMNRAGYDISQHTSNLIEEYQDIQFDLVFTVCDHAAERCPIFPGSATVVHHNFQDPSKVKYTTEALRNIAYDNTVVEIKAYCSGKWSGLL
ncbi:MAG: arsenate reductase [Sphingobacteriales bacterium]|jgi:arsenate reductase